MRNWVLVILILLLAPIAEAQNIDCGPGGADCTDTLYGLGNDAAVGSHPNSTIFATVGPGDGSCGAEAVDPLRGRIRIREQDGCVVSATTPCAVEIPQIANDSGYGNFGSDSFNLGPLGIVRLSVAQFLGFEGNIGQRQLSGTCGISGDECALDSECDAQNAGDTCTSTCFSDPGISCSSENDASCPALDCRTEIEWDGIGLCTDNSTVCSSDAECSGDDVCFAGFVMTDSPSSCVCCQSSLGVICPGFSLVEYPALFCGALMPAANRPGAPDWLFEGGRGTRFDMETIQVPGQQEGLCAGNRSRPCGVRGDFWTGGANGKCTGAPNCAADPFDPANLALASTCDDVAFGGLAGDFCQLSEQFVRSPSVAQGINADGTPDPTFCPTGQARLSGIPEQLCALVVDIPDGDPQPGCALVNIGVAAQPDLDCNGIDDTDEGRCEPLGGVTCSDPALCPSCASDSDCASNNCVNGGDLCAFVGEAKWFQDTNNDDIGDECQCGDGNGDGAITGLDIAAVAICANDPLSNPICDATIIDATGDNATTAEDIGGVVAAVTGTIQTSDLACTRNIDTTQ